MVSKITISRACLLFLHAALQIFTIDISVKKWVCIGLNSHSSQVRLISRQRSAIMKSTITPSNYLL